MSVGMGTHRYAMLFLSVSAFIVFLPSFYYGLLAAADFSDETTTAVPMLAGKLMDLGGFRQFIAIISLNAVIATIMSTADSTVIGGTNIWVCTWVKGFLWPNQSGRAYRWVTYITTPVIAYSAMTFAVHASDVRFDTLISVRLPSFQHYFLIGARVSKRALCLDDDNVHAPLLLALISARVVGCTVLTLVPFTTQIQNSINWQAIPAFVVALYSDRIAAYPLLFGMISGLTVTLTIEVLQALDHNDNVHHYHRHKFDSSVAFALPNRLPCLWLVLRRCGLQVARWCCVGTTDSCGLTALLGQVLAVGDLGGVCQRGSCDRVADCLESDGVVAGR